MGQGRTAGGLRIRRGCCWLTMMAAVCLLQARSAACYRHKKGAFGFIQDWGFAGQVMKRMVLE